MRLLCDWGGYGCPAMLAARRWLPWLCGYSGARVNELTSLYPSDISPGPGGMWCMVIKPSLEKTEQWRVVPIHSHVIDQKGFIEYVEERKKLNKPLFYDPDRSRGGKPGNPQLRRWPSGSASGYTASEFPWA